jgi:hypothetical protein
MASGISGDRPLATNPGSFAAMFAVSMVFIFNLSTSQ